MTEALSTQILDGIRTELNKYINTDNNNVEITAEDSEYSARAGKAFTSKNAFFLWTHRTRKTLCLNMVTKHLVGGLKRLGRKGAGRRQCLQD